MTELELQQRIKDETFISSLAWVILILAGSALYWSAVTGGMAQLVLQAQSEITANPPGGVPSDFMAGIKQAQMQMIFVIGIGGVGSLLLIVTAIAVLKRRRWGRVLMTISMVVLVIIALFLVFYVGRQSYLQMTDLALRMPHGDDIFNRSFSLGARLQYIAYGLFALLMCWLMIRATIKLNRPRIRALFS